MTSQFKYIQNSKAQFLLSICYQIMSAGFVDKSRAKCGHIRLWFSSGNL